MAVSYLDSRKSREHIANARSLSTRDAIDYAAAPDRKGSVPDAFRELAEKDLGNDEC